MVQSVRAPGRAYLLKTSTRRAYSPEVLCSNEVKRNVLGNIFQVRILFINRATSAIVMPGTGKGFTGSYEYLTQFVDEQNVS